MSVVSLGLLGAAAAAFAFSPFQSEVTGTRLVYSIKPTEGGNESASAEAIAEVLTQRLNGFFRSGASCRGISSTEVEVLIPTTDPAEVRMAQDLVTESGWLRFLIIANGVDHAPLFALAKANSSADQRDLLDDDNKVVGRWVTIGRQTKTAILPKPLRTAVTGALYRNNETGEMVDLPSTLFNGDSAAAIARWMEQEKIADLDVLTVVDPMLEVGGTDLAYAAATFDEQGSPAIAFNLTDAGGHRFYNLTSTNTPQGNRKTPLGVVLDDVLLAAPNIMSPIKKEARITGNFTREEVDRIVDTLKAGQLPAGLKKTPVSQSQVQMKQSFIDSFFP